MVVIFQHAVKWSIKLHINFLLCFVHDHFLMVALKHFWFIGFSLLSCCCSCALQHNSFIGQSTQMLHTENEEEVDEKANTHSTLVHMFHVFCIIKHRIYRRLWARICGSFHLFSNSSFCAVCFGFIVSFRSFALSSLSLGSGSTYKHTKKKFNYWNCILSGQS